MIRKAKRNMSAVLSILLAAVLAFSFAGCKPAPPADGVDRDRLSADAFIAVVNLLPPSAALSLANAVDLGHAEKEYAKLTVRAKGFDDVLDARYDLTERIQAFLAMCLSGNEDGDKFVQKVANIGEISTESKVRLDLAIAEYQVLTPAQTELEGVKAAKILLDALASAFTAQSLVGEDSEIAQNFIDMVAQIGAVTLEAAMKQKIDSAFEFYEAMSETQKSFPGVSKAHTDLKAKQDEYAARLVAEENAKGGYAFQQAVASIETEGLNMNSNQKLEDAFKVYDALNSEQKRLLEVGAALKKLYDLNTAYLRLLPVMQAFLDALDNLRGEVIRPTAAYQAEIQALYNIYADLGQEGRNFAEPGMEEVRQIETEFFAHPDNVKAVSQAQITAYNPSTRVYSATASVRIVIGNYFAEVPEGHTAENEAVYFEGNRIETDSNGDYSVPDILKLNNVSGVQTRQVTFWVGGTVDPVSQEYNQDGAAFPAVIRVAPPITTTVSDVKVGTTAFSYRDRTPNNDDDLNRDFWKNVTNDGNKADFGHFELNGRLPSTRVAHFKATVFYAKGMNTENLSLTHPLASFTFSELDSFTIDNVLSKMGGPIVAARVQLNTDRVKNALANAGRTGEYAVRVAIQLISSDSSYSDSFMTDACLSPIITININTFDGGKVALPDVRVAYFEGFDSGVGNNKGCIEVGRNCRVEAVSIFQHADIDSIKIHVFNTSASNTSDTANYIGYFGIRIIATKDDFGTQRTVEYFAANKNGAEEKVPIVYNQWSGYRDDLLFNYWIDAVETVKMMDIAGAVRGQNYKFASQICTTPDNGMYRDGNLSAFSANVSFVVAQWLSTDANNQSLIR